MTTAIQNYTSALMSLDFKVLCFDKVNTDGTITPSYYSEDTNPRYRYIQDIVTNDQLSNISLWQNNSAAECARYKLLQTERSTLLIVINETLEQLISIKYHERWREFSPTFSDPMQAPIRYRLHPVYSFHERYWDKMDNWPMTVAYCLSRKVPGQSRLQIHLWLHLTVTLLNVIKLSCLLFTFLEQQGTPLVTTGDAVASFLGSPCVYSVGMCLSSQKELVRKLKDKGDEDEEVDATPVYKQFKPWRMRYHRSVSCRRWFVYISSYGHSFLCSIMTSCLPTPDSCFYCFFLSMNTMVL